MYGLGRNKSAVRRQKLSRGTLRLLMSKAISSMRINDYRQRMQKGQITDLEKFRASQKLCGIFTFHILVCESHEGA